jgi:hypothetical protein
MPVRLEVRGQAELRALSRQLKDFGDKDLRREFHRALQRAAQPMIARARREAGRRLPHRGGIAEYVEGHLQGRTTSAAGRNPRVRVVFSAPNQAAAAFKAERRGDVRRSRRRHREALMTPEQKAERAELRRAAARKAAASRRARTVT